MSTDLIFPIIAGAAVVILLGIWKTGRAVALAALRHPLRTNVIYVDSAGTPHVVAEGPSLNGQKPQVATAEASKESRAQEEEKDYRFANSRH